MTADELDTPAGCEAVARLHDWTTANRPWRENPPASPWLLFLDLIGWTDGRPAADLARLSAGFLELGMLADALAEYCESPERVRAYASAVMGG